MVNTGRASVEEAYSTFADALSGHGSDAHFCVLGGPGSGKGTLCRRAASEFGCARTHAFVAAAVFSGVISEVVSGAVSGVIRVIISSSGLSVQSCG